MQQLKPFWYLGVVLLCMALHAPDASAQTSASPLPEGTSIEADSLEYLEDKKLLIGSGNVLVTQGEDTLSADYMTVQTDTQDVFARGNVVYKKEGKIWQGQELKYNLKSKTGATGGFTAFEYPYYIRAESSERIASNKFLLKNVSITTCEGDDPDYEIRAREATLTDGTKLRAKGVFLYYGIAPFLYLPTLNRNLTGHDRYFEFVPGYSSRQGAFLLSAYNYKIAPGFKGRTRLDYRSKRGWGGGQDFLWDATNDTHSGEFNVYYADDEEPFRDAAEEEAQEGLVDNERYRVRLNHFQSFTDRDYVIANVNYLSDPDVLEDFFDKEFRYGVQPENRVSLTHRGDKYTAGLLVNKRLNDFYDNIDRTPEVTLNIQRQQIADTPFYYESDNAAAQLEHVFPDGSDSEDYDAFRVDSRHTFFYPTRHFGFLNVIPRTGYRGTYYSDTITSGSRTNTLVTTDTNGVSSVTNVVENFISQEGGDVRSLYEIGMESSFKAFKAWDDVIVLNSGDGLRHISEPYIDYTYNPEPNLRPFELPQFDSVDTLDLRHDIQLGARNKWQTRYNGIAHDLVDVNVYTYYRIEKLEDQEDFSDIFFDTELRLAQWLPIDFDGSYDTYEGEFTTFNTQISYIMDDLSSASVEYRYRRDKTDLISGELLLFPNAKWSFDIYARYDLELEELEEQAYFIQHETSCIGYGLGYKKVDEDDQVWVQLWLTAFPESNIDLGN